LRRSADAYEVVSHPEQGAQQGPRVGFERQTRGAFVLRFGGNGAELKQRSANAVLKAVQFVGTYALGNVG
jgi:hypothetical protein